MSELIPYISRATPFSPVKEHVQQRHSPDEGLRDIANTLSQTAKMLEATVRNQSAFKADSEFLQTTVEAERVFADKLQGLKGQDEEEVKKNLEGILVNDIKPLYGKMIAKIDHPEVGHHISQNADKQLAQFRLKAQQYELGVRFIRAEMALNSASKSLTSSLMSDPSDRNYKDKYGILKDMIDSAPLELGAKAKKWEEFKSELAKAQGRGIAEREPWRIVEWSGRTQKAQQVGVSPRASVTAKTTAKLAFGVMNSKSASETLKSMEAPPLEQIEEVKNPRDGSIPFESWNDLNTSQRVDLVNSAYASVNRMRQKLGGEYGDALINGETLLKAGKNPSEVFANLDLDKMHLSDVLGGEEQANRYLNKANEIIIQGKFQDEVKGLSLPQAQSRLKAERDRLNEVSDPKELALGMNSYDAKEQFIANYHAKIASDPIAWAKANNYHGVTDLDEDLNATPAQLKSRDVALSEISNNWKVKVPNELLDSREAKIRKEQLRNMLPMDVVSHISSVSQQLGGVDSPVFKKYMHQLEEEIPLASYAIASIPQVYVDKGWFSNVTYQAQQVAETIIAGHRIRRKASNVDSVSLLKTGDVFDTKFTAIVGAPVSDRDFNTFRQLKTAVLDYLAGSDPANYTKKTMDSSMIETAFKAVTGGGLVKYEGSYLLHPWGMEDTEFRKQMDKKVDQALMQKYGRSSSLTDRSRYNYEAVGLGTYIVTNAHVPLTDSKGKVIFIDLVGSSNEQGKGQ
ncbi:MAG: hypothetical protein C4617_04710 [Candidatus Liberibacter europaeus]|uniref:Uncharacterized protein n=1 Tax=Candidatus Liberibacter europaeus TaxID=744859 RepID=A0A2T4VWN2_9HYPH|nr:hypothetical protein [Candidatus Liberibacter europaeus]PTL86177.1 MAG: hypothetical protein C4617_04710 [Candidatus Liberibacter europaeus]